jgi:hypothetical protein
MRQYKHWLLLMIGWSLAFSASANINPNIHKKEGKESGKTTVSFRENCDNAITQIDQAINNVRARLLTGGDVWWDGTDGRYVVPKVAPGLPEVSSIFAGAVWLGGVDPAGNLKVAAQTYGRSNGSFDYWPGPLNPETGLTDQESCAKWDKFFVVKGESIEQHIRNYERSVLDGVPYDPDDIPKDVRGWPAKGNEFFFEIHQFELPNTTQGLAGFWDQDGDGNYNPDQGDFPVIEIRGCLDEPQFPDEMIFWIYNDAGNIHAQSQGDAIQMEIQVQAFAYATNDEINDMTFQRYKLINRAVESIDSTFFAMWVDPDLGGYTDDYVGCDTTRSLAYVYNEDAIDGQTGCVCPLGVNTYCEEVPILGVDYFRGPLDEDGNELPMSSFTYYNNGGVGSPEFGTTDPENATEYYNYISGSWKDGSPFTFGDDAFQDGDPVKFAFTDAPDDSRGWSMCTEGLAFGDRRTLQASGPFRLDPGAVNELIVGAVWVADQDYPCPSIRKLQEADDIAQALFDNCFEITDGPDAPDVDFIELDGELIAIFTNDTLSSNNAFEAYAQRGLQIPAGAEDTLYRFEGYKLYQMASPDVTLADLDDPDKARLIFQSDLKNNVDRIFNWENVDNPTGEEFYAPFVQVEGNNEGIRHTFRITEDQFAEGDRRLINHRRYYFTAIAYAFNEYEPFDPKDVIGQRRPYLEGRRNIGDGDNPFYVAIPRPIVDRNLNAAYGEGPAITRLDGVGVGGRFVDISEETRQAIATGNFDGTIAYEPGQGPIEVNIYNPLEVVDGSFELRLVDENMDNDQLDNNVRWELRSLDDPSQPVIASERTIDRLNEQIIKEYGFSVAIVQTPEVGTTRIDGNGVIGYEEEYATEEPIQWLTGIPDDFSGGTTSFGDLVYDYVDNSPGGEDADIDPNEAFTNIGPGYFIPYYMANWRRKEDQNRDLQYMSPAWSDLSGGNLARGRMNIEDLNNVDIVFTSNKDLWSRCVVIEGANRYYDQSGFLAEGNRRHFDLRSDPNVTKFDNDGDGQPDIDTDDSGTGMGWFPGYAVDVETGQRLNIFFAENSVYNGSLAGDAFVGEPTGGDMMFNPSSQLFLPAGNFVTLFNFLSGGQHMVYVTKTPYDECASFRQSFSASASNLLKVRSIPDITWTGFIMSAPGTEMLSYDEGLIPEDVTVKLRVDSPFEVEEGTGEFNGYPAYQFTIENKQSSDLSDVEIDDALDQIKVVPNPYYGFSDYEQSQFTNIVKITNLPAKCTVTIFSLDGKFIRQYRRDEIGGVPDGVNRAIKRQQISPALEWDLRNSKGIPVASGVYLVHIDAGELGERVIKWFGVNRKFDPSGL